MKRRSVAAAVLIVWVLSPHMRAQDASESDWRNAEPSCEICFRSQWYAEIGTCVAASVNADSRVNVRRFLGHMTSENLKDQPWDAIRERLIELTSFRTDSHKFLATPSYPSAEAGS